MGEKKVMLVAMDENKHSSYALEWTLQTFFTPFQSSPSPFKLVILYARPFTPIPVSVAGPSFVDVLPTLEVQIKTVADQITDKARQMCADKFVEDVEVEVIEGDARNVLCDAVDRHHASVLILGSHGYGKLKRAFLGSVSDYCAHHVNCSVMIVKKPKSKN
ncbi:universal stress protein PHOS34-like [Prosopis cineraria]|uniref:universal stress protein PHOS34-like n=1 Tax=Prosopis cineraria TaxID=364024 RepID=UPI00240EC28A|nr:universal stress protein PHOS34-like [Prosopis cineraria]